ncbi:hypothetical protein Cni_G08721 [Canna indica]|uniref:Uncharacterized protein n=1 Tax=Canna indica TaxID=4628 RepID=A0AAQ3K0Y7_9LILI|nr:hypothetical protein Cni_G08721 [Canna indica]
MSSRSIKSSTKLAHMSSSHISPPTRPSSRHSSPILQALAARPGGAPALCITGVGHPADAVCETGHHLVELAHSLCVPFEFHIAAVDRLEDLRPSMLRRQQEKLQG